MGGSRVCKVPRCNRDHRLTSVDARAACPRKFDKSRAAIPSVPQRETAWTTHQSREVGDAGFCWSRYPQQHGCAPVRCVEGVLERLFRHVVEFTKASIGMFRGNVELDAALRVWPFDAAWQAYGQTRHRKDDTDKAKVTLEGWAKMSI